MLTTSSRKQRGQKNRVGEKALEAGFFAARTPM